VEALEGGELAVRFGLADVKNVGAGAVAPLLEAREQGGPFRDIDDLASRADLRAVNKRVLESLIKTGALDALGTRGALLAGVDRVIALSQRQQKLKESGQATMFDLWGQSVSTPMPGLELGAEDVPPSDRLGWEKELLGVYLSEHPFTRAARRLAQTVTVLCGQVGEDMAGQNVTLAGVVQDCRTLSTREGRTFAAATLEDLDGTVEVTAWPDVYETTRDLWEPGRILLVEGRVRVRNGRVGVACVRAQEYQELAEYAPAESPPAARSAATRRLIIVIDESEDVEADEARLEQVLALLGSYPGQDRARLLVRADGREVSVAWPEGVRACEELARELSRLVGSEAVRLETIA